MSALENIHVENITSMPESPSVTISSASWGHLSDSKQIMINTLTFSEITTSKYGSLCANSIDIPDTLTFEGGTLYMHQDIIVSGVHRNNGVLNTLYSASPIFQGLHSDLDDLPIGILWNYHSDDNLLCLGLVTNADEWKLMQIRFALFDT
jgi:hypothetical protein